MSSSTCRVWRARDIMSDALAYWDIMPGDSPACTAALAALTDIMLCDERDVGACVDIAARAQGVSPSALRQLLGDVLRPVVQSSGQDRIARLGVGARGHSLRAAVLTLRLYYEYRRGAVGLGRVDRCRTVASRPGPARAAGPGEATSVASDAISEGDD